MDEPTDDSWLSPPSLATTAAERAEYVARSNEAGEKLRRLNDRAHRSLRTLVIRCPVRGCLLAPVYKFDLTGGGARCLAVFRTASGRDLPRFLNWGFSDDWNGPPVWFAVGCRHGHARIERAWLLDVVGLVEGWKHALQTWDEVLQNTPAELRQGISRRTFHPDARHWRPKQ
ncbi:hypothetical protein ACFCV3_39660 [Kribbella sp. NPDC056345]|uniref:hypothetical protein n=1 Tax=Kribbella sp. NPDC056345 TaxID=3345789 RepID=UPI0035DF49CC